MAMQIFWHCFNGSLKLQLVGQSVWAVLSRIMAATTTIAARISPVAATH